MYMCSIVIYAYYRFINFPNECFFGSSTCVAHNIMSSHPTQTTNTDRNRTHTHEYEPNNTIMSVLS